MRLGRVEPDCLLLYPTQEGTGTTVAPRVGTGNATLRTSTAWTDGLIGKCLSIGASNRGIDRAAAFPNGGYDVTFRFLIKPSAQTGWLWDTVDIASSGNGASMSLLTGAIRVTSMNSSDEEGTYPVNADLTCGYSTSAWNLIHVTCASNGDCKAYLNGALTGTGSIAGDSSSTLQYPQGFSTPSIWNNHQHNTAMQGLAGSFAIYSRVFTAGEISADFARHLGVL
jgi:hypothetical protein